MKCCTHVRGLQGTVALDGDNSSSSNTVITCSPVLGPWYLYVFWRFYMAVVSAHWVEPQWMALNQSRGIEKPASQLFMRLTVVELELLVYIPALIMFARVWQGSWSKRSQVGYKATTLPERKLIHSPLGTTLLTLYYFNKDNPGDNLSFNAKWVSQISTFSYNVWLYFRDVSAKDIHCANVASDSKDDPIINTKAASFDAQVILKLVLVMTIGTQSAIRNSYCEHLSTSWTHIDKFSFEGAGPAANRQVERYLQNECIATWILYL